MKSLIDKLDMIGGRKVVIVKELVLRGAYGRDASVDDWENGKDFKIEGGPYCSIRDTKHISEDYDVITIRDNAGRNILQLVLNAAMAVVDAVEMAQQ